MNEYYVDSAAEGGGSGSIDNPFNSFGQWSSQDVGSTLVFRGSTDPAKPRDYLGGAIYSPKNYVIRAYPGEFVRFTDPGADASLLTFEAWTGGGIDASEGGITFGPGAPNYPEDGTYWLGTLQLTGCSGMYLVGGPDRLLRFAGASDIGLYLVDYPGGGHGAARGCRDITLQGFETTELATGVLVRSGGSPDAPALGGQGVVIQDGTSHHHNLLLDNRGQGSDSGAVGITLYACSGVRVRRFDAHDNHAPSKDYGTDGGAFEAYGARDYVLEDFRFWNNEGGIETGRGGNVSIGAGGIIRHGIIMGSSNMGGHVPPRSPSVLLRDFEDGRLEGVTFLVTDVNEIVQLYNDPGQYGGSIDRAAITDNTFVLLQDSDRAIVRVAGGSAALPSGADAPTIDGNAYFRPQGGTIVGNDAGPDGMGGCTWEQWPARLAELGVVGAEAHGTNVITPPPTPIEPPEPDGSHTHPDLDARIAALEAA